MESVRSPFLDHRIIELSVKIPFPFKLNRHGNKQTCRVSTSLPKGIQQRRKRDPVHPAKMDDILYTERLDTLPNTLGNWVQSTIHDPLEHREDHTIIDDACISIYPE